MAGADASFDVVHANPVIEHVFDLDRFVSEIKRVLAPGGRAIICTENLASWHNVAALFLGFQPFSTTNISETRPIGNPFALHVGDGLPPALRPRRLAFRRDGSSAHALHRHRRAFAVTCRSVLGSPRDGPLTEAGSARLRLELRCRT